MQVYLHKIRLVKIYNINGNLSLPRLYFGLDIA